MNAQSMATVVISAMGMAISWAVWVSVSVFKHAQEIALIKQEIKLLQEVKGVLDDIRDELRFKSHRHPAK
jgi:hypothetical protein